MTKKVHPIIVLALWALVLVAKPKAEPPSEAVPPASAVPSAVSPAAAVQRFSHWSIVVHQAPFNCPPCERLKPEIAKLRDAGWNVRVEVGGASSYPTIVMLDGEREHKRASGYFDAVTIADWPNSRASMTEADSPIAGRRSFRFGCWSCR
jgi:hypothetical protein